MCAHPREVPISQERYKRNLTGVNFRKALTLGHLAILIDNDGSDPVSGTFNNLPEGATFTAGGKTFKISYVGSTGNDVTLTTVTDVSITKTGAATVAAGNNLTYTITAANAGTDDAQTVSVGDVLPSSETFVSLTQTSGPIFSCTTPAVGANGAVTCTLSSFATSGTAVFSLVVKVAAATANGASINNTATISTASGESSTANNTSTATTTVSTSADLAITKSAATSVTAGQNVTYSITVTSNGPSDAAGVSVTDVLSSGITFVSATPTQGSCSGTTTVTCSLGRRDCVGVQHRDGQRDDDRRDVQQQLGVGQHHGAELGRPRHYEDRGVVRDGGPEHYVHDHRLEQRPVVRNERHRLRCAAIGHDVCVEHADSG